jgi:hypothetical protein
MRIEMLRCSPFLALSVNVFMELLIICSMSGFAKVLFFFHGNFIFENIDILARLLELFGCYSTFPDYQRFVCDFKNICLNRDGPLLCFFGALNGALYGDSSMGI